MSKDALQTTKDDIKRTLAIIDRGVRTGKAQALHPSQLKTLQNTVLSVNVALEISVSLMKQIIFEYSRDDRVLSSQTLQHISTYIATMTTNKIEEDTDGMDSTDYL